MQASHYNFSRHQKLKIRDIYLEIFQLAHPVNTTTVYEKMKC